MNITSEINPNDGMNAFERRIYRKKSNELKKTKSLKIIIKEFVEIYSNTYTIDLFIYKSKKKLTIIEIQYLLKTNVNSITENEPSLHCKIGIPPYHKNEKKKYDINWELGGINHNWRMLIWKFKYKLWKFKRIIKNAG